MPAMTARLWNGTAWADATVNLWDPASQSWRARSGTAPAPLPSSRRPSVWGERLDAWVADPTKPMKSATLSPADDVTTAIRSLMSQAVSEGATDPTRSRVRVILTPGVYAQRLRLDQARTHASKVGVEVVGQTGDPADVIFDPGADGTISACEHAGITALISGVHFRRQASTSATGWAMHGSGHAGVAHELILHRVHLEASGADAFSHELGPRHTLYVCDSKVTGSIYQHTIMDASRAPTLAMWDNVEGQPGGAHDEGVSRNDLMLIRSGVGRSAAFGVGFQRTGSSADPHLTVHIDPASGITQSKSALVRFNDPDVASHPILDQNPVMRAYWGIPA